MRLDHLLSKEIAEAEMRKLILWSIRLRSERNHAARSSIKAAKSSAKRTLSVQRKSVETCALVLYRFQGSAKSEDCGGLAQLGERLPCKQEVSGSIPLISTTYGSLAQLVRAHA